MANLTNLPLTNLSEAEMTQFTISSLQAENFDLKDKLDKLTSEVKELIEKVKLISEAIKALDIPSEVSIWWLYSNRKKIFATLKQIIAIVRA